MITKNSIILENAVKNYSSNGLTTNEVKSKLDYFGSNSFPKERINGFKIFLSQFINPLSFILIFAAALSVFMGEASGSIIILSIVIINSFLSFFQEFRSGKAVEKLSDLIEQKTLVVRDNEQIIIDTKQLVPGDTIILRNGDIVPADIKIMEAYDLSVNESQLTGESVPINKGVTGADLNYSILYTGSVIEKGHCKGVVFATGKYTELGKIALLSKDTKKVTPYQKNLSEFISSIMKIIGATIILMLVVKSFSIHNMTDLGNIIIFSISLAMAVTPEALPMITTVTLSNGALQLAKQKVIAKRLSAIEDLGRINILCTDKTGTLTEDSLTISDIVSHDKEFFQILSYASIEDLNVKGKNNINSFDNAFLQYIPDKIKAKAKNLTQLQTVPFDPDARRRRMIVEDPKKNKSYLVVIGAPETLMKLSKINNAIDYASSIKQAGKEGMRQLAISYKEIKMTPEYDLLSDEKDLIFLGFAKLLDPLRKTAKATMLKAQKLGIAVKILTGDSIEVAEYIGKEIGLINENEKVYSGKDLEKMTAKEFEKVVNECSIFARVTPEQKYNIIKQLKTNNIVGYQGDGINDAPSLKLADASIAVHNATAVAKDSSDIVLLEDDLSVILNGVHYGRSIYVNINKYIKHAMIGNIGNFFSMVFFYIAFAADTPMLPIQLLLGNIIQDLPLMTVFSDSVDMDEISKPQTTSQINSVVKTSLILGAFTAIYYLIFFLYTGRQATPLTQTTLFLFYNFTQLLIIISVRSKNHLLWKGRKPSLLMIITIVFFMAMSLAITYIPLTASLLGFVSLPISKLGLIATVTIIYIFLLDFAKIVLSKLQRKNSTIKDIIE